ncbi:MAG: redoxin domain-containing protein, partial [Verrucomicrobiota bacterium]|nr:redoxin domain-containing protein [Verrucomicrobiota bacterium]
MPDFSTRDESGNLISKSSLLGTSYLIYFYPRDNTPGCT